MRNPVVFDESRHRFRLGEDGVAAAVDLRHIDDRDAIALQEGDVVAVFGREKFTMSNAEGDFTQKWVQVYTFREGLIARMEEYATSAPESDYNVITE